MSTRFLFLVATLLGLSVVQTALAEPQVSAQLSENGDTSYRFGDEDLLGATLNGMEDMFGSRPKVARVMLLRPRTNLIQEILKSVENL